MRLIAGALASALLALGFVPAHSAHPASAPASETVVAAVESRPVVVDDILQIRAQLATQRLKIQARHARQRALEARARRLAAERAAHEQALQRTVSRPPSAPTSNAGLDWAELRHCESGGNYQTNTGNGYYGAYQFSLATWRSLGYSGYPHQASPATQDEAARRLLARSGDEQWPACGDLLY